MTQQERQAEEARSAVIQLRGLTCPSCVARIEGVVRRMDGVRRAQLHFASQRLLLELTPGATRADHVASRIRELGYQVVSAKEVSR